MASLEEQKKLILPFAQRAQEVETAEPKVAYYCRLYALEQGLQIKKDVRAKEIGAVLGALADKLEKDKAKAQLSNPQEDAAYCESFALTVFNRADRVDRAGRADRTTAMTFYAASYFFEILRQFGEMAPDTAQQQRYAAWRAAEISKAVKEGRQPDPPPSAQAAADDEAAMLDELAKLEMGARASSATSDSLPSAASAPAGAPAAPDRLAGLPSLTGDFAPAAPQGARPPPPAEFTPPPPPQDGDGELRLPSPPKSRPVEGLTGQGSGAPVWTPPPIRRFQTFQKVLFRAESDPAPVRGTIAKVEEGAHPEQPTYLVALPDRIAAVHDPASLAPELATGEGVMYHASSGHSVQATVAEVNLGHWPPSYLVRLADGSYVDTTDDRLTQLHVPKPRSEANNLDALGGAPGGGGGSTAAPPAPAGGGLYPPPAVGMGPPVPPASRQAPPVRGAGSHMQGTAAASPLRPHVPAAAPPAAASVPKPVPGFQPGLREITDASKLTKSATSALQFEDVNTAVRLLTEALALLTQPR